MKTKRMINMKASAEGGPVFTFGLPGGQLAPRPPSVTPLPFTASVLRRTTYSQWKNLPRNTTKGASNYKTSTFAQLFQAFFFSRTRVH